MSKSEITTPEQLANAILDIISEEYVELNKNGKKYRRRVTVEHDWGYSSYIANEACKLIEQYENRNA